jgi:ATP-binding cassette subfamily B (MDR/TAP) protein 6
VFLACTVTFTFVFDTMVVLARVFLEAGALSVSFLYYIGVSWLAWAAAILCLLDESHKFSKWYWVQYAFFALAALGETLVGWVWTVGVYKPRPGKRKHSRGESESNT